MSEGSKSSADYGNNLIFAERDDVVRGFAFGLVYPAVHFIGGGVDDVAFRGLGNNVIDRYSEGAFLDDDDFFVDVPVGRVGRHAGAEFGEVHFDKDAGVVGSVHDGSGGVGAVLFDGEVFEDVSFGGEVEFLGFGAGDRAGGQEGEEGG